MFAVLLVFDFFEVERRPVGGGRERTEEGDKVRQRNWRVLMADRRSPSACSVMSLIVSGATFSCSLLAIWFKIFVTLTLITGLILDWHSFVGEKETKEKKKKKKRNKLGDVDEGRTREIGSEDFGELVVAETIVAADDHKGSTSSETVAGEDVTK